MDEVAYLGVTPQQNYLIEGLSVRDHLSLFSKISGTYIDKEEKVEGFSKPVHIGEALIDYYLEKMSLKDALG